jgi:SAM-dependent methyltransferase
MGLLHPTELYERTQCRLRAALTGRLPEQADMESTLSSYAYWVCTAVESRGVDWETTLDEYAQRAQGLAGWETESELAETELLRQRLREMPVKGSVLDVGAGWGRMAALYTELGLQAVYVEPSALGVQLVQRNQPGRTTRSMGEALPFADGLFDAAVTGWVLHHHKSDLDAVAILRETARVLAGSGLLFSIEPLVTGFGLREWKDMLAQADFSVDPGDVVEFYRMPNGRDEMERHTLMVGRKG